MSKTPRYRPMRHKQYQEAIARLKQQHPWLDRQIIQPAPGHLAVLTQLILQCEQLMHPVDYRRRPLLCVTATREKLAIQVEILGASLQRELALLNIVDQARFVAQQHCPVCGAVVFGGEANAPMGVRCAKHAPLLGLFAEEIQRFSKATQMQSAPQPTRSEVTTTTREESATTGAPEKPVDRQVVPVSAPPEAAPSDTHAPKVAFLEAAGLRQFVDRHRAKADEKFKRSQAIAERIRMAGHERRELGVLPEDWKSMVDAFAQDFPNFSELAELLHDHFALTALGDGRIAWPPLLLVGPAGIGKTEAARWLSERLALPSRVLDMASAQSGSQLAGSEAFWSNSEPGLLFELLAYQPKANPVVVLDEIDKADQAKQYDPLAALYTLLEPRSARKFTDLSIRDFSIDASHVNWIATANSLNTIPGPILSRVTVLQVHAPSAEQVARIAQTIYGRLRAEASWGSVFAPVLEGDVLRRLRALHPRGLALALRRALGSAARAARTQITVDDLPVNLTSARCGMGFTAIHSE